MSHKYTTISTTIQIFLITVFIVNSIFIETVNTNTLHTTEFYEYKYRLIDHPDTYTVLDYDNDGEDEVVVFHIKPDGYLIRGGITIIGSRGEETSKYYRYFIPYYITRYKDQLLLIGYFTNLSNYVVAFTDQTLNIRDYISLNISSTISYPPLINKLIMVKNNYILPLTFSSYNKTYVFSKLILIDMYSNKTLDLAIRENTTIKDIEFINNRYIIWGYILVDLKTRQVLDLIRFNNISIGPKIVYDTLVHGNKIYTLLSTNENNTLLLVFDLTDKALYSSRKILSNTSILKAELYVFNNSLYFYIINNIDDKYSLTLYRVKEDLDLKTILNYRDLTRISNPIFISSMFYFLFEVNETIHSSLCDYYDIEYTFKLIKYNLLDNETLEEPISLTTYGRWICDLIWVATAPKPRKYINMVLVENTIESIVLLMGEGYTYIVDNEQIKVLVEPLYTPLSILVILVLLLINKKMKRNSAISVN